MNFTILDEYIDPRKVDLEVLDNEIKAGNHNAVLLKTVIHLGGFDRGLPVGEDKALDFLSTVN
jgi:hypothetical protein